MKSFIVIMASFHNTSDSFLSLTPLTTVVVTGLPFLFEFEGSHQCRFICLSDNFLLFRPYDQDVLSRFWSCHQIFFFSALHHEASFWRRLSVSVLKVGTEGGEFVPLCILLLPLLTDVLPALQTGIRAEQWDNQMQALHEGTSDIFFFSHSCTVATDEYLY